MANTKLVLEHEAQDKTKQIYEDIKKTFGILPNFFKAMGSNPDLLEVNWNRVKTIMIKGKLDRKTKEFICLAVSATNSCGYCVSAHTAMLKQLGATDEEIIEAVAVADLFSGFNSFANGLQIEPDLNP